MKRIILLMVTVLYASLSYGQLKLEDVIVAEKTLAADTTNISMAHYGGAWTLSIKTASLDAADAQLKVQVSNDRSAWYDYSDNSTFTLQATNTTGIRDAYHLWNYMRVVVVPNSVTSGTYEVKLLYLNTQ